MFLYLGYSPKAATATALAFVIPTAWASIMKGHEHVDVTLAVLLAVGAVVGAYAIGQPLVQSPHLDPRIYNLWPAPARGEPRSGYRCHGRPGLAPGTTRDSSGKRSATR